MSRNRYQGPKHEGQDFQSPYPVSRLAPSMDLVDMAKAIAEADQAVGNKVNAQMEVIARQIRELQAQARDILEKAERDSRLHRARCSFNKRAGQVYFLYEDSQGEAIWSMLSPRDWGKSIPYRYLGAYQLEVDQTWTETSVNSEV